MSQNRIKQVKAGMPQSYRKMYMDAVRGEASPRAAIKINCLECMGFDRGEVKACESDHCPLFQYRPYQEKSDE